MTNETEPSRGELVPAQADPLRSLSPLSRRDYSCWPQGSKELVAARFAASEPADFTLADVAGQHIELAGWYAHIAPVPDRVTGEIRDLPHLVLFVSGKQRISSYSEHTLRSLALLMDSYGGGPWDPPLKVKVNAHRGKVAGYWYTLIPVDQ